MSFFPLVGYTAIVAYITQIMSEEIGIIFGGLGLIIFITLWILFRSLSAVVWPLMVIVFTLIWTIGFVGWSQIEMGGMFEAIQFLMIVVGVGDAVHILSGYLFFRNHQLSHDDALKDPEVLNKMDQLQQKLLNEQRELVVRGMSLVNVVKSTNQVLNENRAEMYKIPQDRKALEEVLFLFNNGNPDDRRNLVSDDYRKASIHLSVRNTRFTKYRDLIHLEESEKNQIFKPLFERYPQMDIRVTGPVVMEVHQELYVTDSLYRSLFITLAVISVILLFLFGSIREGFLVALIPNLFPITIIFGLMGILGFPLDTFTLVVVPVVIGIAVDDTIHFLTHYKLELQKHGNVREALQHTLNEVGQAVIFTSLILSSGLFFMTWASSIPISRFGMLAGIAILAAMIADLFLLPALCQLLNVRFESSSGKNGGTTTLNLGKKEINFE